MISDLSDLKRKIFNELLERAGRVFIQVRDSDQVVIGTRGFLPEEKEKGIVLVFNSQIRFAWDDRGLTTTLVFGTTPQKCFIPVEAIISVFSPDLHAQFSVWPEGMGNGKTEDRHGKPGGPLRGEKVVRVDFRKKDQQ